MNSTILTVMRKELARFFGDYRMVMTTILLPGILIFVLYQFMGDAMLSQFTTDKFAPKCSAVNIPDDWSAELKKPVFGFIKEMRIPWILPAKSQRPKGRAMHCFFRKILQSK